MGTEKTRVENRNPTTLKSLTIIEVDLCATRNPKARAARIDDIIQHGEVSQFAVRNGCKFDPAFRDAPIESIGSANAIAQQIAQTQEQD